MNNNQCRDLFLTGPPSTGKSTLVEKLVILASGKGLRIEGFFTPEVRERGRRVGFDLQVINGPRVPLARRTPLGDPSLKFAGYFLNPRASEVFRSHLPLDAPEEGLLVLDEIGPMELYVPGGREYFHEVLGKAKGPLLGVVHRKLSHHDPRLHRLATARSIIVDLGKTTWEEALAGSVKWLEDCVIPRTR